MKPCDTNRATCSRNLPRCHATLPMPAYPFPSITWFTAAYGEPNMMDALSPREARHAVVHQHRRGLRPGPAEGTPGPVARRLGAGPLTLTANVRRGQVRLR